MNESTAKILALLKKLTLRTKSKQTRADLKLIALHIQLLDDEYDALVTCESRYNFKDCKDSVGEICCNL